MGLIPRGSSSLLSRTISLVKHKRYSMFYMLNMSVNEARIVTCIVNHAVYIDDDKSVSGRGGGTQDKSGTLKITWNDEVVFSCDKCVTAPAHELAGITDGVQKPMRFYFKYGIYNWRMGKKSKEKFKDMMPPMTVVYYKNVTWENK